MMGAINFIHAQGFFNHAIREGYRGAIVANVDGTLWLSDSHAIILLPESLSVPRTAANLAAGYGIAWHDGDSNFEVSADLGSRIANMIECWHGQLDKQVKYELTPWRYVCQPGSMLTAILQHPGAPPVFVQQRYVRLFNEHLTDCWKDPADDEAPVTVWRQEPETGMVGVIKPMALRIMVSQTAGLPAVESRRL